MVKKAEQESSNEIFTVFLLGKPFNTNKSDGKRPICKEVKWLFENEIVSTTSFTP